MLNSVKRSAIFSEFTTEEQNRYFSIKEKAVSHHIDTLYYSVYLENDGVRTEEINILNFIEVLSNLKEKKANNQSCSIIFFDLDVYAYGTYGGYSFRLSEAEYYDIFIAQKLANDDTPRILVQLRTQALIEYGPDGAIELSLDKLRDILCAFGLNIIDIQENRIDYAFHTNVLQKPLEFFGTNAINDHLLSPFNRWSLQGYIAHRRDDELDIDYFTIGSRKSNYVFFRAYNKVEEVIQQNYKGFFFKRWFDRGLISEYDLFVFGVAFALGSYKTGLLVGRCRWYLKFGKNEELKEKIRELLVSYYENSSNNRALEKEIKGILPPTTVVFNLEFETKRKYYALRTGFIDAYNIKLNIQQSLIAIRLYKILNLRREFIDNLTSEYVSFVDNRHNIEPKVLDWWDRVRRVRLDNEFDQGFIYSWIEYSRQLDVKRQKNRFAGNLAALAMIHRVSCDESTLGLDLIDALSLLSDNDIQHGDLEKLIGSIDTRSYQEQRTRKRRQVKALIESQNLK